MDEPFAVDTALKINVNYLGTAHSKGKYVNLDSDTEVDHAYVPRKTTPFIRCSKQGALCVSASILISLATVVAVLIANDYFPGMTLALKAIIDSYTSAIEITSQWKMLLFDK